MKRRHVVGETRQSTELTCDSLWHWLQGLICGAALRKARLAAANPPPRKRVEWPDSSSCSQRKVWMSSTSYHSGSNVVASPISAARSHVLRATRFRSPCDLRKQLLMRVLQADEVVAAVACRPKHHPVAGLAEGFNRLHQQTGWQGRAVAIDEQDAVMSGIQQERASRQSARVPRSSPACSNSPNPAGSSCRMMCSAPAGA